MYTITYITQLHKLNHTYRNSLYSIFRDIADETVLFPYELARLERIEENRKEVEACFQVECRLRREQRKQRRIDEQNKEVYHLICNITL